MSNKKRRCEPDLTYHTMSRCADRQRLLKEFFVKKMAILVIKRAQKFYSFKLIAFEIVDNHVHFVIQTVQGGESISLIMQYIKARIAESYNRTMGRSGPFWNERYKDIIVEEQENPRKYLLWLLWYLAYNSVKAGLSRDPRHYRFSSIMHYLEKNYISDVKITLHQYFMELGNSFSERVHAFLFYEEAYRKRYAIMF